jgi:hypothetical protein
VNILAIGTIAAFVSATEYSSNGLKTKKAADQRCRNREPGWFTVPMPLIAGNVAVPVI